MPIPPQENCYYKEKRKRFGKIWHTNDVCILGEINKFSHLVITDEDFTETLIKELINFDIEYQPYKKLYDILIDNNFYNNELIILKYNDYDLKFLDITKLIKKMMDGHKLIKNPDLNIIGFFKETF